MKIEVNRKTAVAAMKMVRFAGRQPGDKMYSCVQIVGHAEGTVELQATDLQMWVSVQIPAQVDTAGVCALPGKALGDVVGSVVGETITCAVQGDGAILTSGGSRCRLLGRDAEDFPCMPEVEGRAWSTTASVLSSLVDRVRYCMSTDTTRPHVNGALLEIDDEGCVTMVSTDGHRLAWAQEQTNMCGTSGRVLLPAMSVQQISEILHVSVGEVRVITNGEYLALQGNLKEDLGTFALITAVGLDKFPPYQKVIPRGGDPVVIGVDPGELADAAHRVAVLADSRNVASVKLTYADQTLCLEFQGALGNTREQVVVDTNATEMPELGLNAKYLAEALASATQPVVELDVRGTMEPLVIREEGYTAVIMPMRLG